MLVDTVEVSPKTSSADSGSSGFRQLTYEVTPNDADDIGVTYEVEQAEGLSVSQEGLLEWTEDTPAGSYTTTVTANDGGAKATHSLTLTEPEPELNI